jgi:AAA+ ATPase superfamily predicted ATPase
MAFVGRAEELGVLKHAMHASPFCSILIYGRRRVGKTELIKEALKGEPGRLIHFQASKTTKDANLTAFYAAVADAYHLPTLSFPSFKAALDFIGQASRQERTLFVIDEYSYFRSDKDRAMDSDLQAFIDTYKSQSNLAFYLCGSIVRIMSQVLGPDEPLRGRFDAVINLQPFDYYESGLMLPGMKNEDKFALYSALGGIPQYLSLVDTHQSVKANLSRLFFGSDLTLQGEAASLLSDELPGIENAVAIFTLLGHGQLRFSDINARFSKRPNGATDTLEKLVSMSLIAKEVAINQKSSRSSLYSIKDPFFLFYYALVEPNRSKTFFLSPEQVYERCVEKEFSEHYLPHAFELVATQFLARYSKAGKITPPLLELGAYTYDEKNLKTGAYEHGQFDVVSRDERGYTSYECKYWKAPLTEKDMVKEAKSVAALGLPFYRLGFFSRKGFAGPLPETYACFSLDDLYRPL